MVGILWPGLLQLRQSLPHVSADPTNAVAMPSPVTMLLFRDARLSVAIARPEMAALIVVSETLSPIPLPPYVPSVWPPAARVPILLNCPRAHRALGLMTLLARPGVTSVMAMLMAPSTLVVAEVMATVAVFGVIVAIALLVLIAVISALLSAQATLLTAVQLGVIAHETCPSLLMFSATEAALSAMLAIMHGRRAMMIPV